MISIIIIFLLILNIFINKNIYLKYFSIFFLIIVFFCSINIIQKKIVSIFLFNEKKIIINNKNYSIIVLGGNHEKRLFKACEIINNYRVDNILIIKDSININLKNNEFGCLNSVFEIENKLIPSSTIDDVKIIKSKLDILNNDIIIVTDDFHIPRLNTLLKDLEKNYYYYPVRNLKKNNYDKYIDIMHGIKILNILSKEYIAMIYYKIFINR